MSVRHWQRWILILAVGAACAPAPLHAAGRMRRQVIVSEQGEAASPFDAPVVGGQTVPDQSEPTPADQGRSVPAGQDESIPAGEAEALPEPTPGSPLFSNYYTVPGVPGTPAQLYLSPRPTPPLVGHTYITYPPFQPHEYLYRHRRTIASSNPDGSQTTVRMRYGYNPFHQHWRTPRVTQKTKVDPVISGGGSFTWWRVNPAFRD